MKRPRTEHVLQEDHLKLDRVLAAVVAFVGVRVEALRAIGEGVDRLEVRRHSSERSGERLAGQRNGSRIAACDVPNSTNVSTSGESAVARAAYASRNPSLHATDHVRRHKRDRGAVGESYAFVLFRHCSSMYRASAVGSAEYAPPACAAGRMGERSAPSRDSK